ncbi:PhnD/SsuA/transferrin family substrate-binding protein [Rhodosalinus sediminis]|uniref:sensor histidine kinase n=1 Tax=Rhodosalinus sediminis TaxID=1940533 RepID=UPI002356D1C0|nr:PhnD/SsuA/transferrin family substrate-binding protein [Rhodosalinus sediminis]
MRVIVTFLAALVLAGPALADTPLRIGVLSYRGAEVARGDFRETARHLRGTLTARGVEVVPLTLRELDGAARRAEVDFIFTNPGHSFQLVRRHGASRLATARYPARPGPQDVIGAAVVVRAEGPVRALPDLVDRRLGVVDAAAFGGHLLARKRLAEELGAAVRRVETVELGFPQQSVLDALRDGRVEAGVLRACLLEALVAEGAVDRAAFRVLGARRGADDCARSTGLHPGWAMLTLPHVPTETATRVLAALLSQPARPVSDPLDPAGWLAPVSYASVEEVYRALELYPFERDLPGDIRAWLSENVVWVAVAAILLGAFLLHVVRVEYLVVRRTRELEAAAAERRALEAEMAHANRVSSMATLAGSLAHDLNQPLAAIASFAGGLRQRRRAGTDDAETTDKVLARIVEQANRAAEFIRSMRAFLSRGEAARAHLDLRDVADDAVLLTQGLARAAGLTLDWRRPPGPMPVMGDAPRLRQVFVALIQNAIDASPAGGVVTVGATGDEQTWRVSVADSGPGLDDETRRRATEAFFTTKGEKGLGLGLSTALAIAEDHGGRLWLEPRAGGGTVAVMELPMDAAE